MENKFEYNVVIQIYLNDFERFVVLTMVGKKIMTLCRFVGGYQHLRVTCVLHIHSRRPLVLKMKAVVFFKRLVPTY